MANKCNVEDCSFIANYDDKCALHCKKSDYQSDNLKGVLADFYELLVEYILIETLPSIANDEIDNLLKIELNGNKNDVLTEKLELVQKRKSSYISQIKSNDDNTINAALQQEIIVFQSILFPEFKSRDYFNFFNLFKKFKGIHFDLSIISFGSFNLPNIELFFQDCTFTSDWTIHSYSLLDDVVSQSVFQQCTFQRSVASASLEYSTDELKISHHLFNDCKFNKQIILLRGIYIKEIFNNSLDFVQKISNIHIENCKFEGRFKLNNAQVNVLKLQNMEFEEKVELKNNDIDQTYISNVNFKKLFDAYKSKFKIFSIKRSIFDDFTGFEKCEFGKKDDFNGKVVEFEYVTFLNFTNFRKAIFHNGLDFEHTNLKESPNFLNANINYDNTTRETYRIIKHSFDKIGNQIEANKYFSLEMRKYKKELKEAEGRISSERLVLWFNDKVSGFGSNIFMPLFYMLLSIFLYYLAVKGYENNCLYKIYEPFNESINILVTHVNLVAKGIPPYGRFLKEGMEFVTLLFHILFLTFTWHFIVAIKRCTKR